MDFGTIASIEIGKNLDSGEDVRLAQVNITGEDTVTVEMPFPEGDEFSPEVGDTVYYEEVDPGFLLARCIQTVMPVDSALRSGERELFSRDGRARKAKIRLEKGGEVRLNEGTDYGVRFDALEASIKDLLDQQNNILTTIISHTHIVDPEGLNLTAVPSVELSVPPIVPPAIDMSAAKAPKVNL